MKNTMQNVFSKIFTLKALILIIALANIFIPAINSKKIWVQEQENNLSNKRNLQYGLNSIYYNIAYPANDITGTGDRLKDVPYKVLCKILSCVSGCCVGEIDNMRCGLAADCKVYSDYANLPGMIAAIVVPIGVFFLLIAFSFYLVKFKKYSCCGAFCMCAGLVFIVTIPIVIYYLFFKKYYSVTSKNPKESSHDDNIFLVNNKDAEANTLKNEPEKLLINHNVNQKRHRDLINSGSNALDRSKHQEYKKLSSEDNEHKQIIGISGTDIYSEKMKIRIPDPTFDDNFHNEKSHNTVRINSIHHKLKEEEEIFDENGQQRNSLEKNKEAEDEEFKNRTRSERDQFIEGNNDNKDQIDLLVMEDINNENVINQQDDEKANEFVVDENNENNNQNNNENNNENNDNNNENEEEATPENGEAKIENAEENPEQNPEVNPQQNAENEENTEIHNEENNGNNQNNQDNENGEPQNNDNKENNGENNEVNDNNNNNDIKDNPVEAHVQVQEANNGEEPVEQVEDEKTNEEHEAPAEDKQAENAEEVEQAKELVQNEGEKTEGEANAEEMEKNPEGEVEVESRENAEQKEDAPQE